MKPSIIFRVQRFIKFILKGVGKKEQEHYLFTFPDKSTDLELYVRLAGCGWTPNYMGYPYKGQIYQCRRLLKAGKYQLHVRIYRDGTVTGHFEITPEWDTSDHLSGVDLRTMNKFESLRLKENICGVTGLKRKFQVSK